MLLMLGALLGLISVVFGAIADHLIKQHVSQEYFSFLATAIRYNQIHAVVIVAIGLVLSNSAAQQFHRPLKWSGVLFVLGTILFCFSIYCAVSFDIPVLLHITPLGGVLLILAWAVLAIAGFLAQKKAPQGLLTKGRQTPGI